MAVLPPTEALPTWYERAACQGVAPELFFDEEDPLPAQGVCSRCPVREHCLEFALEQRIRAGVWGGLTPSQRQWARLGRRVA